MNVQHTPTEVTERSEPHSYARVPERWLLLVLVLLTLAIFFASLPGYMAQLHTPCAGVGLLSMRERAAESGGFCLVESAPGCGTHILAHLPLPKD